MLQAHLSHTREDYWGQIIDIVVGGHCIKFKDAKVAVFFF